MENKGKLFLLNEDFVDKSQLDWRERLDGMSNHTHDATGLRLFDFKELEDFIAEVEKLAREEGRRDGIIEESIKRYAQAKEDGTLDKHFPIIKSA